MARLTGPVATLPAAAAAGQRTFPFSFDVEGADQVVVTVDGVVQPVDRWVLGPGEVTFAAGFGPAAGAEVVIRRDTPTERLTGFTTEAYARGAAVEVGFTRMLHLVEELVAETTRIGQEAGRTALPQSITSIRADLDAAPPRLYYTDSQGVEYSLALPEPDFAQGAAYRALVAQVEANTADADRLRGGRLRTALDALPDNNLFTNARASRLDGLRPWVFDASPPIPGAGTIKTLYEANADTNAYTDADRARVAALPADIGDVLTEQEVDTHVGDTVGRVSAFFREAVVDGFFVAAAGARVSRGFQAEAVEVLSVALVAGQTVGVQVAGYDDVVVASDRLLSRTPEAGASFSAPLRVTLSQDGRPSSVDLYLGRNAQDRLLVAFSVAGAYNVLPVVYSSPAEVAEAQIDARVASWARAEAADASPPALRVPDANLPDAFPAKWGKTHTDAQVDARADARVAALTQSWARSASELIPSTRIARLTADKLPADFVAPQSDWGTTNNKPAWTGVFDGSYGTLTGRPVPYSVAQVVTDLEGLPAGRKLQGSALRNLTTSLITDFPDLADVATSGSYTDLSDAPSLSGDSLAVRLRGAGAETFPYSRVSGGPSVDALVASGVKSWVLAAASDPTIAAEIIRILGTRTGADRLPSTSIDGMLESTVHAGVSSATELGAIDTNDGIHFAVIDTAFGDYAVDDFLIFNSASDAWVKVGSFADTVIPALAVQRQGTGAVWLQLGAQAAIRIQGANGSRSGVMTRSQFLQQQRNTRALAQLHLTTGDRRPISTTGVDSFSGLDRLAIIRDVLDEFPFYESRANRTIDGTETDFLTVPSFTERERTYAQMGDAAGTVTRRVTGPANTNPASWGTIIIGFDYLEGGERKIVPEFGEPTAGTARLDAGYGSRQGHVVFRTAGGAVLYAAANPFSELVALRFWATGETAAEGHFRLRYLTGSLSAGAIVNAIPWRNLIQDTVPAGLSTAAGDRRPVRKATAAERDAGTATDAVLTVDQVHALIPEFTENGVALTGPVRRINFRTVGSGGASVG